MWIHAATGPAGEGVWCSTLDGLCWATVLTRRVAASFGPLVVQAATDDTWLYGAMLREYYRGCEQDCLPGSSEDDHTRGPE